MKKNSLIVSSLVLCLFAFYNAPVKAQGYIHKIQIGGDGNYETIEYFDNEKEEEQPYQTTTINYNYITPVNSVPTYYSGYGYHPYYTGKRTYRVINTYPAMRHMPPPPPPRHHLHHGHRPPPPRHHHHNRIHIGVPGIHVSF